MSVQITQSEAVTRGIRVRVESEYVPERSDPLEHHWFFAYHVKITNEGKDTVQLTSRHWFITDSSGRIQEVRGAGVVGEQPVLRPNESFEYSSFCPLHTSFGTMHGTYEIVIDSGGRFEAEIAPFALGEPHSIN